MLFKNLISVYPENYVKPIHIWAKSTKLRIVKVGDIYIYIVSIKESIYMYITLVM
jgi:hypothetical protein